MCGIAGAISIKGSDYNSDRIFSFLENRGPDNLGFISKDRMKFYHTRLSIIGLEPSSNQPFVSDDERYVLIFNGEIYNYLDLRLELEKIGVIFHTSSDTEVLLKGLIFYGQNFVTKLTGMWAFSFWDSELQVLLLSRDRVGEKPLYYSLTSSGFYFASNLGALCEFENNYSINKDAVASLFALQYIPTEQCIYHGIQKLSPATNLLYYSKSNKTELNSYWNLDYKNKFDITFNEAISETESLLENSIKQQLSASDVPVGIFLSGGIDSGLIAAIASKHNSNLEAVSMTVPNSYRDESSNAIKIARKHGIKLHLVESNNSSINSIPQVLKLIEPIGDSSLIPLMEVSQFARNYFKVVLTGDGGDEGFGAYGRSLIFDPNKNLEFNTILKYGNFASRLLSLRFKNKLFMLCRKIYFNNIVINIGSFHSLVELENEMPNYISRKILQHANVHSPGWIQIMYDLIYNSNNVQTIVDLIFYLGIKFRLPGDYLFKVDSGSMFHSIECRSPFLNHELLEFSARLPSDILLNGGIEKSLLKEVALKYNDYDVVNSPKKGFSIPKENYFKGKWDTLLRTFTKEGISADLGIIKPEGVLKLLDRHHPFRTFRFSNQLYNILVFEIWLRVFHLKRDIEI